MAGLDVNLINASLPGAADSDNEGLAASVRRTADLEEVVEADAKMIADADLIQQPTEDPYENDTLNDVFESEPSSPSLSPRFEESRYGNDEDIAPRLSATDTNTNSNSGPNGLLSTGSPIFDTASRALANSEHIQKEERRVKNGYTEPSDIPRLKEKHETEGYRDGITKGKAQSIQTGFDEGYSLGATLGLRIGKILGLLEGILGAVKVGESNTINHNHSNHPKEEKGGEEGLTDKTDVGMWKEERNRIEASYKLAKVELSTQRVFGKEYWDEEGIWKFVVPGEKLGEEGKEVTFKDVVEAHPLVGKWDGIVTKEIRRWGLDLDVFAVEDGDVDGKRIGDKEKDGEKNSEKMASDGANTASKEEGDKVDAKATKDDPKGPAPPVASGKVMGFSKGDLSW